MAFSNRRFQRRLRRIGKRSFNPLTQRRRRFYKKVLKKKDQVLLNSTRPSMNIPINPRYLTKFTMAFSGYTTTAGAGGFFGVKLNSPYLPLNNASIAFTDVNNLTGAFNSSTVGSTAYPRGFTSLCSSSMYNRYRVYASKIKVTMVPSVQADTSILTVTPFTNIVGLTGSATNDQSIAYSKEAVVTQGSDNDKNTVKSYIDLQSLYGLSREQIMANEDLSALYNQSPSQLGYWIVRYQRLNGGANYTNVVSFNVEVTYYTELFEMNYDNLPII